MALLLCSKEHETALEGLVAKLAFNPLLRYRVWQLWKALASPREVLRLIREHQERVAWHVERIYRTRNLLVHSGRHFPYLETLVDNVHRFFHGFIAEVLHALTASPPAVDLESAVLGIQLRYRAHLTYLERLSATPYQDLSVLRECLAGPGKDWDADPLAN